MASPANGRLDSISSPEADIRPGEGLDDFDTVYACGSDDYDVPLPATSDIIEVDQQSCVEHWAFVQNVWREIDNGQRIRRQACCKPQIKRYEEGETI